jgi:hypothetical protein
MIVHLPNARNADTPFLDDTERYWLLVTCVIL